MAATSLAFALLTLAGCSPGGPTRSAPAGWSVTPGADGPADEPVHLVLGHQAPGQVVTVTARATVLGASWSSSARFRVGPSGEVDLDRQAPLSGSYSGTDGMGLLWSLRPASPGAAAVADLGQPEQVDLQAGRWRLHLTRQLVSSSVRSRALAPGPASPLDAEYVYPASGAGAGPAVVIIGGAEGGLSTGLPLAAALASHGLRVLDLAYFGVPGLPQYLSDIPLEYFAGALRWLGRQPGVDPHRLYLYGVSRGTEAALLTASYFPSLVHGVVALVPASTALCGAPHCVGSAWSYRGRPLPFTHEVSAVHPRDDPSAVIPIGRFGGRVLLVCAGRDQRWKSCAYATAIGDELHAARRPAPETLAFTQAGHGIGFALPYLPELEGPSLAGSSPEADPRARAEEWPEIVFFLEGR